MVFRFFFITSSKCQSSKEISRVCENVGVPILTISLAL